MNVIKTKFAYLVPKFVNVKIVANLSILIQILKCFVTVVNLNLIKINLFSIALIAILGFVIFAGEIIKIMYLLQNKFNVKIVKIIIIIKKDKETEMIIGKFLSKFSKIKQYYNTQVFLKKIKIGIVLGVVWNKLIKIKLCKICIVIIAKIFIVCLV